MRRPAPELEVIATDSGAWADPAARMSEAERIEHAGAEVAGIAIPDEVLKLTATGAIKKLKPDLVLASWLPPGPILDRLIRADVKYVLDVGAAGGVTTSAWSWRFAHEFLEGGVERYGRCRLDERPAKGLQTRVTLYFGRAHPEHWEERPKKGDWLYQFKPAS